MCASAPVSDSSAERQRGSSAEYDRQADDGDGDGAARRNKDKHGQEAGGRRRSGTGRSSFDRLKPVLGYYDDVKQYYAFDKVC